MMLPGWRYEEIKNIAVSVLLNFEHAVQVPVDVFALAESLNITLVPYSSLTEFEIRELRRLCDFETKDGFSACDKKARRWYVYYDDSKPCGRVRFTVLHEIGHVVLGHIQQSDLAEAEANFFAKYAIAPPVLVHRIAPNDYVDIANKFDVSNECAWNCFVYYQKWLRSFFARGQRYEEYENDLLQHFCECFVA